MKKFGFLSIFIGILLLGACGKDSDKNTTNGGEVLPLNVELTLTEQVAVGETVKMEALVTYGDEKVKDADKVVYEVWEEGKKDDSVMIDSVNEKNGLYTAETSFDHDGLFHIQVHVDAKQMHSMPVKEVTVGKGVAEIDNGSSEHEHGHTDGFALHFVKPENAVTKDPTELLTHLQMDGQPLEKANVRYEIWTEQAEKHEWVNTEEMGAGEYKASYQFTESGAYTVKVHVENDDGLHEHEEFTIDVK